MSRRALALLCASACVVAGCEKRPAPIASKEGGSGASGPGASVTTTNRLPVPANLADVLIPEGSAGNDGFTLEFHVRRDDGDAGKTYDQAAASCRKAGRMLCTETQWMRACDEHSAIGKMESWTASRRGRTAVVRGGRIASGATRSTAGNRILDGSGCVANARWRCDRPATQALGLASERGFRFSSRMR